MTDLRKTDLPVSFRSEGLHRGIWTGQLSGAIPPRLLLMLRGEVVAVVAPEAVGERAASARVAVPIPAQLLQDGAQCFLLLADNGSADAPPAPDAQVVGRLPVMAGQMLADDVIAEIALLRDELELVKRALRHALRAAQDGADQG